VGQAGPGAPWTAGAFAVGVLAAGTVRQDGASGAGGELSRAARQVGRAGRELGRDLADEVGRWAAAQARASAAEALASVRAAVPAWRDPARVHARRLRRARRAVAVRSSVAGGLAAVAATAWPAAGLQAPEVATGGGTVLVGAAAVAAGLRLRELRRSQPPLPAVAPARVTRRVPRDSPARGPLDRLAERERSLIGLLAHLGPAGREPATVAASAAGALRDLGARLTDVDHARRGAGPAAEPGLSTAVTALTARLHAGLDAYDALVVAAAEAVAAEATLRAGDPVLRARLTEATDSLAGYAAGLHDLTG